MSQSTADFRSVDLIIGYGNLIGRSDMHFNVHFIMNKYEWDEKITLSNLLKLRFSLEYDFEHSLEAHIKTISPSLQHFYEFHIRFSEHFNDQFLSKYLTIITQAETFPQQELTYLKQILSDLETWLLYLINHLREFSKEVQQFCQQCFFHSPLAAACFKILLKSKQEVDGLLQDLNFLRSLVLEKATLQSVPGDQNHDDVSLKSQGIQGTRSTPIYNVQTASSLAANTYFPKEHQTVVSQPFYDFNRDTTALVPAQNTDLITLKSNNDSNMTTEKLLLKGQPLTSDSPLAQKLSLLRQSSNAKPGNNNNSNNSEIFQTIERLRSFEGIPCTFFIPLIEQKESNPCPARIVVRNYLPLTLTTGRANRFDPHKCIIELHLQSEELGINVTLTFNIYSEVLSVQSGVGSSVALPPVYSSSSCCHLLIKDKPEVLLSLDPSTTTNKGSNITIQSIVPALNHMIQEIHRYVEQQVQATAPTAPTIIIPEEKEDLAGNSEKTNLTMMMKLPVLTLLSGKQNQKEAIIYDLDEAMEKYDQRLAGSTKLGSLTGHHHTVSRALEEVQNPNLVFIQQFFWMQEQQVKKTAIWSMLTPGKKASRLWILRSDRMVEVYTIPLDYDLARTKQYQQKQGSKSKTAKLEELEGRSYGVVFENRQQLSQRLEVMKKGKYLPSVLLSTGFVLEKSLTLAAIRSEDDPDEDNDSHSVAITIGGSVATIYLESKEARKQFLSRLPTANR